MMIGFEKRDPQIHRAMSEYLGQYITDARQLFCPSSPAEYPFLQQAWLAGDNWDNPQTPLGWDPLIGTYCYYWNYVGFIKGQNQVFRGPSRLGQARGQSQLLMSDYFGYDHWRSRDSFSSCERLTDGEITPGTWVSAAYWSRRAITTAQQVGSVRLQAAYTDGHVEVFEPATSVPMHVSIKADGTKPYPDGIGPGVFYLPAKALRNR